jgi:CheY-like chemotaxis protein
LLLLEEGYEIQTLASGEKVFEAIGSFHSDLVLMDVMLANMDGRTICRQFKANDDTKVIPVILILSQQGQMIL